MRSKLWVALLAAAFAAGTGYLIWLTASADDLPPGIATGNGRVEAERIDVATKFPGRIEMIQVDEGDTVEAGQVLARMDADEIEAQLREADAGVKQAWEQQHRATAEVMQRQSELTYATQELSRALRLREQGHVSEERVEQRQTQKDAASATLRSAEARIAEARAAIEAAVARVERLKADLREYALKAPRSARVQYRLAEPGEVLAAGGKVLSLLDLTDVHMTIFLPTKEAGRLALGSEARIVLDAAADYVIPAKVSFVAAEAQFTPKYVETASEREKLMFRVKVQVPRDVLEKYAPLVKTGIPGVAFVKTAPDAQWPERLGVKLP